MNPTAIQLAGCLIFDSQKKLLLIHRQKGDKDQWETPGGKIDPGETPQQAAIRELKEEVDVDVKLTRKVGENDFTEDDRTLHYTWFQAQIVAGTPKIMEPQTFTELKYFPWDQVITMHDSLSANTKNLARAYQAKTINIR
jgi:8-oxo-dGTP diphosphatase